MAKAGKRAGRPAHKKYVAENRNRKHKELKVLKSSHGKWTYDDLVKHQKEVEQKGKTSKKMQKEKRNNEDDT